MKRMLYGAVVATAAALAPGLALAQYVGYGAPQPYYGAPSYYGAPAYQPYAANSVPFPMVAAVPPGYVSPGFYPGVDIGQASASTHGPYSGR
jgi:hypothetical protein